MVTASHAKLGSRSSYREILKLADGAHNSVAAGSSVDSNQSSRKPAHPMEVRVASGTAVGNN